MINQIKPEEQNDVLRDCAERLERLGIAYMLTDSIALIHYAIPRMTADIDIVLEISSDGIDKFIEEFEPDYYVPHGRCAMRFSAAICLISSTKRRLLKLTV